MNADEPKHFTFTVENEDGEKISLTISAEKTIYEVMDAVRLILSFLTFSDELIDEVMPRMEE